MVTKKVLLIGDFLINRFYYGNVNQIARDAPIPILNIEKTESFLGSSGMVIEVLSKLGIKPIPIGVVGMDSSAEWMLNKFSNLKISINRIIKDSEVKTPVVSRLIAGSTQLARFDEISHNNLKKNTINKLFKIIENEIKTSDLVVICDYGFGMPSEEIINKIISEVQEKNIDLFVSSSGINYLNYKNSNAMIRINLDNSLLVIKENSSQNLSIQEILTRLEDTLGSKNILLTLSHKGIAVYEEGVITEMPATQDKVVDLKGIGEVMIAAIIYSLFSKNSFLEACKVGNIAAGIAASKGDARLVSKKDIMNAKKEYDEWLDQK
jgi:D-beta-D-heptose 7-phosphate kinase/D-beta-D-heptose 1-phosphate adenosyltransferase